MMCYISPCTAQIWHTADKYSDKLSVIKFDVENANTKDLKVEMLLQGVRVSGLPTLLLYNNRGEPLASHSGVITETELEGWIEDNLLSKWDEFEAEPSSSISATAERKEEGKVGANDCDAGSKKRGFISLASQVDDYAL